MISKLRERGMQEIEADRVSSSAAIRIDLDDDSIHELKRRFVSGEVVGCDLLHFLPSLIALAFNAAEEHISLLTSAIFGTRWVAGPVAHSGPRPLHPGLGIDGAKSDSRLIEWHTV